MINDHFATLALENSEEVLERNQTITRGKLAILSDRVEEQPLITWVKPRSGTTALLKVYLPISSRDFCVDLLQETSVMFTPGSALNMEALCASVTQTVPPFSKKDWNGCLHIRQNRDRLGPRSKRRFMPTG